VSVRNHTDSNLNSKLVEVAYMNPEIIVHKKQNTIHDKIARVIKPLTGDKVVFLLWEYCH
jgi:hypothetical protein